jgi:hypothetical protein
LNIKIGLVAFLKEQTTLNKEGGLYLTQVPTITITLQPELNLLNQTISIHRPVKETVNVGGLIYAGKQVVQLPKVDVAGTVSAKTFILVVVFDHRTYLLITKQ